MKHTIFACFILGTVTLVSCGSNSAKKAPERPGERKNLSVTLKVNERRLDGIHLEAEFTLADIAGNGWDALAYRGVVYAGKTPQAYFDGRKADWLASVDAWAKSLPPHEAGEREPEAVLIEKVTLDMVGPGIVTATRTVFESRSTQAHGEESVEYLVIDTREGRQVTLEEALSRPVPEEAIDAAIRERYKDRLEPGQPLAELGFRGENFWPPDTFTFTKEGLGLLWNAYGIAPYSLGAVAVTIPYNEVTFTERGQQLANLARLEPPPPPRSGN